MINWCAGRGLDSILFFRLGRDGWEGLEGFYEEFYVFRLLIPIYAVCICLLYDYNDTMIISLFLLWGGLKLRFVA